MARTASNRALASVALAALLAACATAEDVQKAQQSWQGASYEEVLHAWGAPNRSTKTADGRDWHTWVAEGAPQPGPSVGFGVGGVSVGRGSGVGVGVGMGVPIGSPPPPERCERTLVFADNRVVDQRWNGPPSLCAPLKRQ